MKKLFNLLLISALVLGFTVSCSSDDEHDYGYGKKNELNAQFRADVASTTRVTGNNWDMEDAIGIYAIKEGQALDKANVVNGTDGAGNSKYTTVNEGASSDFSPATDQDIITFDKGGAKLDFIAYYPYTATVTDYKLAIDVSNQSKLAAIDVLYSNNAKAHDRDTKDVPLQFTHQLTQLVLEISSDDATADLTNLKVTIDGLNPTGSLSLADGVVAIEGTTTKEMNLTATKTDKGAIMNAIVIPTQDMQNTSFVFDLNGEKYKAWTPETLVLESGKRVTYTLTLTSDGSVIASVKGNITDWVDVPGGDGILTPEEETPGEGITVPDADKILSFTAGEESKVVNVTAPADVTWTATAGDTWIQLENATATGNGALTIKLEANPEETPRIGTVTIAQSSTRAAAEPVVIQITQAGNDKPVEPEVNLLFPGSDFEDWAAFTSSLAFAADKGVKQGDVGRNGGKSMALNFTGGTRNAYLFTVKGHDLPIKPSKITFYMKGLVGAGKSLSMNVYDGDSETFFNLGDCSADKEIESSGMNDYNGAVDTKGEWVKVTLNVTGYTFNASQEKMFSMKYGKGGVYDLLIDDITIE